MEGINTKLERVMSEPVRTLLIYALQHIAAMCAGAIAVPIILGGALGLPQEEIQFLVNATLMVSGVGTMIQTLGIGKKITYDRRCKLCRRCCINFCSISI
ncbi:MAG: solute carrier family 23 protein [Cetobacterium sp.]